ncbi:hypothetical protein [Paraburkholderia sp. D1E]|uniref:hypothetical protein n=1 Tax=Paraburkholderia sp. D1E TaxID=3461398 RepID=UPI004045AAB8
MDSWDWEFFATEVMADHYAVTDHGPLRGPVTGFALTRNKALDLMLATTSAADSTSSAKPTKAGVVYIATEEVKLAGRFGAQATATGVIPLSYTKFTGRASEASATTETSSIQSLQWQRKDLGEVRYTIEWVENMSGPFVWPHSDGLSRSGEKRRTLHSPMGEVVFSVPVNSDEFSRSCVHLFVEGLEIFIGVSKAKLEHISKPGFILYKGAPDEDLRRKIRDCLSFSLGNFLVYLGETSFDDEWTPVTFTARSGHALVEEAASLTGVQPAPLGQRYLHEISPDMLGRMVSSLYRHYDAYRLQSVFWSYWHALAAPVHMAAAHFGAAIESLQKAVFDATGSEAQRRIVADEIAWKRLYKEVAACITKSDTTAMQKELLIKRAQNMNFAPQGVVADRLFDTLGLKLDALERSVWANRNRAAHGGSTHADQGIRLIRENKVLRVMMNRMLLAISNGSDFYYDYYTVGHPLKRLADPIEDDRKEG